MTLPVITIDGPAGVGKSTAARLVSRATGIPCLNTGAMFRCMALKLGESGLKLDDADLRNQASAFKFRLEPDNSTLFCNETLIGNEVRNERVGALASAFGKRAPMREILAQAQRKIAMQTPLVAEGRDMGTVVFPDAALKFFLEATPEARALRRYEELKAAGESPEIAELEKIIRQRDEQDRTRELAPLKPASDAIIIDTSLMSIEDVRKLLLSHISEKGFQFVQRIS